MSEISKAAFVGLGNMGAPMVAHLAKVVGSLSLFDLRTEVATAAAEAAGGSVAKSLAEAAEDADLVIAMLPNAHVVRSVLFGEGDCLTRSLPKGAVVVDMSSSYPPITKQSGAELLTYGATLLDAPVSGGVKRAVSGELAIMLGGDDSTAMDRVQPALESMGKVFRTGPLGSGHALKALNNYVSAAGLTAACVALQVGKRFGLDPSVMIDTINASTGRNNATERKFHSFIIPETYDSGFALDLMAKDLRAAADLAQDLGLALPPLEEEADRWTEAKAKLEAGADHTEIFRYLAGEAAEG